MAVSATTRILKAEIPVSEFVEKYVDIPKFMGYCKSCPNYGKKWSCPPYEFNVPMFWTRYEHLSLMAMQVTPMTAEEKALAAKDGTAFLVPYRASLENALAMKEKAQKHSYRLNPGQCVGCGVCARIDGKPCRREEMCRYSLESLGTDVGKVSEELLGVPVVWGLPGEAPEYFLLVGGILT